VLRKIGIVGGIGWRSTVDYYTAIHELAGSSDAGTAGEPIVLETVVESLDLAVARELLVDGEREGRWAGFDNYHRAALMRLDRSEAEVAAIACNTPHERLENICRGVRLKVVDLFEAVCAEARQQSARRLLVLGTRTTMHSVRLRTLLGAFNIQMVVPERRTAEPLEALIHGLQRGHVPDGAERLLDLVREFGFGAESGDIVGLHCTELPLALPNASRSATFDFADIRFLDASMAHVHALLREAQLASHVEMDREVTEDRVSLRTGVEIACSHSAPREHTSTKTEMC